jgi:hypothetical protein
VRRQRCFGEFLEKEEKIEIIVRNLVVILVGVCVVAEPVDFHLEPIDFVNIKSSDGIRSYPVLKVSFMNPKYSKKMVLKTKGSPPKSSKYIEGKAQDNVQEKLPMSSREDIKKMKKLSFHGREPPPPITSGFHDVTSPNDTQPQQALPPPDFQHQRKYTTIPIPIQLAVHSPPIPPTHHPSIPPTNDHHRRSSPPKKIHSKSQPHKKVFSKSQQNDDKGFQPLMRPSPINIPPHDPPSFQTMRNYVDYLKLRQKQFFAEFDEAQSAAQKHPSDEVEYFVQREQELAEEQRPKEEQRDVENADVFDTSDEADEESTTESRSAESRDESDEEASQSREENFEDESRKKENFVPFRMYAQVRHIEAENHKPKSEAPEPKVTQKLALEKKNVFYQEEGYEEKEYDHGAEKVDHKYRAKRSVVDYLPVASALVNKADLPNLKGEKLLKHLDELLKKSEAYLPDDDEIQERKDENTFDSVASGSIKSYRSQKYPYYALPDSTLNTMSAFRYSENLKNFPRAKESLYDYKNVKLCQEIDREPDPVPKDIEQKGKSTEFNEKPRRLKGLGDKINCYKEKYFGKDPFDNPLFKEEFVSESIQIPYKDATFISHQANPLITVYDDVISNIRAAFAEDLRKKKEQELLTTTAVDPPPITSNNIPKASEKIPINLNLNSGSRLPIFDITNFQPKLNVPTEPSRKATKSDYEMEFVESPKNLVKGPSSAITNLRPPNLAQEKRRRRNPVAIPISIQFAVPRVHDHRPSHFLQPPNKFKLV